MSASTDSRPRNYVGKHRRPGETTVELRPNTLEDAPTLVMSAPAPAQVLAGSR